MRLLAPGVSVQVRLLRSLLLALPCACLLLALPEVPHWAVVVGVVLSGAAWARTPDHPAGAASLVLLGAWWSVRGVVDWRVLAVAALLLAAHVAATLVSYGPPTLAVDGALARAWLVRGLLALVPAPVAWVALRGLDPAFAPSWLWLLAGALTVVVLLATARLTRPTPGEAG